MNAPSLVELFEREGRLLDGVARPRLAGVLAGDIPSYLRLLKMTADYACHTVPALRAASEALSDGDTEDRAWSSRLLDHASTDHGDTWALADMRALAADDRLVRARPLPYAVMYGSYFVAEARRHPYAILGANGVLAHFSIGIAGDIASAIAIPDATFFRHHVAHLRDGDNLDQLSTLRKRMQVVEGAYFTTGTYRSLLAATFP